MDGISSNHEHDMDLREKNHLLEQVKWLRKKSLAAKLGDNLSSTHTEEGENLFLHIVLAQSYLYQGLCAYTCICVCKCVCSKGGLLE